MDAPGTKSVIIDMELVRSAPGVCAISLRLTRACGVAEEGFTVSGAPDTSTVSWCCAIARAKCISCTLPEVTVTDCCAALNPGETILTSYWPTGTLESWAMPSSFVVPDVVKADVRLCASTWAPCTGRCCGSCTMVLMVPKTDASAAEEASNAHTAMMAIYRFDIFHSPEPMVGYCYQSFPIANRLDLDRNGIARHMNTAGQVIALA